MTGGHRQGDLAVDTGTNNLGDLLEHEGPYIQLRPVAGGREWDTDPARIRPVTQAEWRTALREGTRTLNAVGGEGAFV